MRVNDLDAFGHVIEPSVPDELRCSTCTGTATRIASVHHVGVTVYHHYRCSECQEAGRMDGGTLVTKDGERSHGVGPVFRPIIRDIERQRPAVKDRHQSAPAAPRLHE